MKSKFVLYDIDKDIVVSDRDASICEVSLLTQFPDESYVTIENLSELRVWKPLNSK